MSIDQLTTETGYRLCYIVPFEAFYRSVVRDRAITVSKSADGGGCDWEFQIVEHHNIGIRAEIFDDAFRAFTEVAPLFTALAEQRPTSLDDVRALLDAFGLADETERTNPHPAAHVCACGCDLAACANPS